jgi:phage portal protein BeeE
LNFLGRVADVAKRGSTRYSIDQWINEYLLPSQQFTHGGNVYAYGSATGLRTTYDAGSVKEITNTLPAYSLALRACPPAFAAQMVRALVLSQARFVFRSTKATDSRKTFGTRALDLLEHPWPNATTGELISRMEWHSGLTGNAFVHRRTDPTTRKPQLRVLRPDWVGILYGSELDPDDETGHAIDSKVIAYVYQRGGIRSDNTAQLIILPPDEVAHWSPHPDPESPGIGMSWITPAVREIMGDRAATEHKLQFFRNGATPNLVISGIPAVNEAEFQRIVQLMDEQHSGIMNAYKTLYLAAGADATIVGSDFQKMDFANIQGRSENRIAYLSRVPASLLGISEGLQGSTLNAGNFGMARRMFADTWVYPSLQDISSALVPVVDMPSDAELWFDTRDMPILREDAKDAAEIQSILAATISSYITAGFTPESSIAAAKAQDPGLLVHTGLLSVQLWEPGAQQETDTMPKSDEPSKPAIDPKKQKVGK